MIFFLLVVWESFNTGWVVGNSFEFIKNLKWWRRNSKRKKIHIMLTIIAFGLSIPLFTQESSSAINEEYTIPLESFYSWPNSTFEFFTSLLLPPTPFKSYHSFITLKMVSYLIERKKELWPFGFGIDCCYSIHQFKELINILIWANGRKNQFVLVSFWRVRAFSYFKCVNYSKKRKYRKIQNPIFIKKNKERSHLRK